MCVFHFIACAVLISVFPSKIVQCFKNERTWSIVCNQAASVKPDAVWKLWNSKIKGRHTRKLSCVLLPKSFNLHLPGWRSWNGPSCVHQHTPAVASGLVALDRLVQAHLPTVRDEDGLLQIQTLLIQRALSLLVTRGNFLYNPKKHC